MSETVEQARPSGREQLQALVDSGAPFGIMRTLNFAPVEIGDGAVVFEGHPSRDVYNPIGTVHGGFAAAILDSACGCAVHSKLQGDQAYTTLELKVAYHRAITADTGVVRAEGRVLSFGRRAAFSEARLVDATGRLLASATSSLLVMSA